MGKALLKTMVHKYSHEEYNKKILILGILPPPLGGVSVHIKRVMAQLKAQGCTVEHYDIATGAFLLNLFYWCRLLKELAKFRPEIVHYHGLGWRRVPLELIIVIVLSRAIGSKIVVITHSVRFLTGRSRLYRSMINRLMYHVNQHIIIGADSSAHWKRAGYYTNNVSIEGAFLPPQVSEKSSNLSEYPSVLTTFLEQYSPLILMNASQIQPENASDLYGRDTAEQMLVSLKNAFPQAGLIIVEPASTGPQDDANILRVSLDNFELWPLFEHVDLFIRPTLNDGQSISIEEALCCAVPVIASDCVKRQAGVITYKTDSHEDFVCTVERALCGGALGGSRSSGVRNRNI